jgi:hypothetical protein
MNNFKYDIAISLCKQDLEFARKLVAQLNPGLSIFFYEDRQEELISKSGPEEFARIFKEQARIVVILSRDEWSKTTYTAIESNAIVEKFSKEGYGFLFVIPMEPGQVPTWYFSTRIYADPRMFNFEQLAKFIEFKVTEEGGIIKPITSEDLYQNLLDRIEEKKKIIHLQISDQAIKEAQSETQKLKELFNQKLQFLQENSFEKIKWLPFSIPNGYGAHCTIGGFQLDCNLFPKDNTEFIVTTQDICVSFKIINLFEDIRTRKPVLQEKYLFYYTPLLKGWSKPYRYGQVTEKELPVLFSNGSKTSYYDLKDHVTSEALVDESKNIERYL